ncbi:MAG: sugar phosphate isomerase/epimerase [Thermomicrobia bacterium]|nr:sugar phosphate isomerase/epimerase [Thermomicrobia bacterium]MCA1724673.1 sugar phosphate isomerase/epimerase [Thermomicrobia bacterium]
MNAIGSASSPRWHRGTVSGLAAYLSDLQAWGAGAAELVLHHDPATEQFRFVHVIEQDWNATFAQYHARGIACHAHASLAPGFRLEGWHTNARFVQAQYTPLLAFCARMAQAQGHGVTLVVHGAGDTTATLQSNQDATRGFLQWAEGEILRLGGVQIAIELLRARGDGDVHAASGRQKALAVVRECDPTLVGICWDIEHDWFNGLRDPHWTPRPPDALLDRVIHAHVHDANAETLANHYPLVFNTVPYAGMIPLLIAHGYDGPLILEIRYRHALALGDPLFWMGHSYAVLHRLLADTDHTLPSVRLA